MSIATALALFQERFGAQFTTGLAYREQHAHTQTWLTSQIPDGVLFATDKDMIQAAVRICAEQQCPIIPFGVGTSLEGQVNAPQGGICIDVSRMDKVLQIHAEDLCVTVQPGVTREALNHELRHTGLFFPIDPGANATIGGMTGTRASGTNAVRYGTMKDVVLSLELITPQGELIRTATRAKKSAAGYDLTRLYVGSEGTLGIFTEITLKVFGRPELVAGGVCAFPSVGAACNTVIAVIQSAIPMARIELLDAMQIKACNQYSKLNMQEQPTLFVEFHGSAVSVEEQAQQFSEIAEGFGAEPLQWSSDAKRLSELWKARHNAYFAVQLLRPGCKPYTTDACVPISRLAECVEATQQDIAECGFLAAIVGHVGDGNFHVVLLVDQHNEAEVAAAEAFVTRLSRRAIAMDGTCTGEHGIGQGKQPYLQEELGAAVGVMRLVKQALDPQGIMNPGKIFG